ncbi:fibronectin type-III domain-containing protein [Caerostris extrusa]|uniref:Fibronectin type-III domain-containing protein n=1 Tax=Caerostris extrusa TaxID=172846 RepID=A0AAV4ML67_CAEEX|nr:fibronectin type-III domain-containing protein [Caerostris extrusa]
MDSFRSSRLHGAGFLGSLHRLPGGGRLSRNWSEAEGDCKQRNEFVDRREQDDVPAHGQNLRRFRFQGLMLQGHQRSWQAEARRESAQTPFHTSASSYSQNSLCLSDVLDPPSPVSVVSQKWNSLEVNWPREANGWLATFYNVRVCQQERTTECSDNTKLEGRWNFVAEQLSEFTAYDVTVEGILEPINVKTSAKTSVYTYPKSPVRFTISPIGKMVLETPILVAMGMKDAKVEATVSKGDEKIMEASGDVREVNLDKLIPEESYDLLVKSLDSDWKHSLSFSTQAAQSSCSSLQIPGTSDSALWSPTSLADVESAIEILQPDSDFWLQDSTQEDLSCMYLIIDGARSFQGECSQDSSTLCSWGELLTKRVVSSRCCEKSLPFVCAYRVKADLGRVSDLLPSHRQLIPSDPVVSPAQRLVGCPKIPCPVAIHGGEGRATGS